MATYLSNFSQFQCIVSKKSTSITFSHFFIFSISVHPFQNLFHGEMHMVIVTYPSSFSQFWCTVSEKLIFVIFRHFLFFSKSMHPLITILLWEVHNNDRNMLSKFHIDPIYRSGAMEEKRLCHVKIQRQQHEGANLNVKPTLAAWIWPEDTCTRKNSHESATKPPCNHRNQCMQQMKGHSTSQQPHSTSRYVTKTRSSDCMNVIWKLHEQWDGWD